ncbi:DoxX family protein [Citricoccus sp. NPDC055426]|uniref:DoxX family protein n=1 Tax=Citricoccus sp. NPDC055426 TaxID=3155536 RepID=UPI00341AB70F
MMRTLRRRVRPRWPLLTLAGISVGDALLCVKPAGFVRDCLLDVGLPRAVWPVLPVVKTAAAAGLVAGTEYEPLARATAWSLVVYFGLAMGSHLRARDFGRNLFVNATGMMISSCALTAWLEHRRATS